MSAWSGWDPETYDPPACPTCGATLGIHWFERRALGRPDSSWVPGKMECPTSRFHNINAAYVELRLIHIAHSDLGAGTCPLSELDYWRGLGWWPLEPELQTATEAVEQRVAELGEDDQP